MAIVKSKHASNFTVIPNEVFKQSLSIEAIGLLTFLISLPHDWVVYKTTLHTNFEGMGEKKMDRVFKELQDKGYIVSVMKHESGRLKHEHIVYDKPWNGEELQSPQNRGVVQSPQKQGVDDVGVQDKGVVSGVLQKKHTQSTNTTKETSTNFKIKIATASFLDLTAYLKGEGLPIYQTVTAKRKDKEITDEAILAALNDKYPVYEFRDTNHVINAINACIRVLEANKKKGKRDDDNRSKMVY